MFGDDELFDDEQYTDDEMERLAISVLYPDGLPKDEWDPR